jgi:hypothetical protein
VSTDGSRALERAGERKWAGQENPVRWDSAGDLQLKKSIVKENKETEKTKIEQAKFTATISLIQQQEHSDPQAARKNCTAHSKVRKTILSLRSNKFTINPQRSPSSLTYLIGMKI